jgi:hypothetical protein
MGDSPVPARHESPVTSEPSGSPPTSRTADTAANRPQSLRDDIDATAPDLRVGKVPRSGTVDDRRRHDPAASPPQGPYEPDPPRSRARNEPGIRPPWPSASERQSGPTPSRRFGPDASAGHYSAPNRSGSELPQHRDIEQRHRPTLGNDRRTHEPEAGQ